MILIKYQLVIQFPEEIFNYIEDIDEIANLEDRLLSEAIFEAEVDGHDIGSGKINIFVHTNNPVKTFETIKNKLEEENFNLKFIKIAYREIGTDKYIVLWPHGLEKFSVC